MSGEIPTENSSHGGIRLGNVGGDVEMRAGGDIVAGDKVSYTIISPEVVKTEPFVAHSPYRGLNRFDERHKELFFGRKQLTKKLLVRLSTSSILMVLGGSGSGKSSLVLAGLLPELDPSFCSFSFVPDVNPFDSLRCSLMSARFSQSETAALLNGEPDTIPALLRSLKGPENQWLLFVDQFEELFTETEESLRAEFVAVLSAIARDPASSIKIILAMRADFLDRVIPFKDFAKLVENNIELLTEMQVDELRLAIEQPAAHHGVIFQDGLVDEIIKEVHGQAGSLPLLQYTLNLLWEEEEKSGDLAARRSLRIKTYRELGGVRGALQKRADEIYSGFSDRGQSNPTGSSKETVKQVFLRLVDIATRESQSDVGWRPVRRRVPISSFLSAGEQAVLKRLIDQKLLVSNRDRAGVSDAAESEAEQQATVEVAHEALFTCWKQLNEWISGARYGIFVKNKLADDALRWKRVSDRDRERASDELWIGSRLDEALELRDSGFFENIVGGLSELENRFLSSSATTRNKRLQDKEEQRQRELKAAQDFAETERRRAEAEHDRAEKERELRLRSIALALAASVKQGTETRERSLLFARQAYLLDVVGHAAVSDHIDAALRSALEREAILVALRGPSVRFPVAAVSISSDSRWLAAAYDLRPFHEERSRQEEAIVQIWSVATLDLIGRARRTVVPYCGIVEKFPTGVQSIAFDECGLLLGILDGVGDAWVFEIFENGSAPLLKTKRGGFAKPDFDTYKSGLRGGGSSPFCHVLVFDSNGEPFIDGDEYFPASARALARQHNLDIPEAFSWRGSAPRPYHVAASPNRRYLYYHRGSIGTNDAYLYKLDSSSPWNHHLGASANAPVAFSGDSQKLFTASWNGWDLSVWPPESVTVGDRELPSSLADVATDYNGETVAISGDNGVVWIWRNVRDSSQQVILTLPEEVDTFAVHPNVSEIAVWLLGGQLSHYHVDEGSVRAAALGDSLILESEKDEVCRNAWQESVSNRGTEYHRPSAPRPGSLQHWVAGERRLRVPLSQRKVFGRDGRISRLGKRDKDEWIIATHDSRNKQHPVESFRSSDAPNAVGYLKSGEILAAFAGRDEIRVVNTLHPDEPNFRLTMPTGAGSGHRFLWVAFDKSCTFVVAQMETGYSLDAGAGKGGPIYLWDLRKLNCDAISLPNLNLLCTSIAFDNNSERVALGLADRRDESTRRGAFYEARDETLVDGAVLLYDLRKSEVEPLILNGPKGDVICIAFNPLGDILAAGTSYGRIAVFRLMLHATRPLLLEGHTGPVLFLGFEKTGTLLSIGSDRTVRTWITETAALAEAARLRVSRNLTRAEWARYIGEDVPYQSTCADLPAGP